ncbi:YdeI/OmpD-associated family protein [Rhodococcus corynebacterioides]|nr:YdeI/OmpD-associated family protein [Rhodococcus corynebacterioides]MBY6361858.1 YdeI/OmpD-associated family protein [Rhodococcus corynebacterioides]
MGGENLVGLNKAVRAAFDALAPSARKEHARSVADAKRADTRARRVAAVVAALRGA